MYSSDVGKMIGCPVLHVNGDNPEVIHASCCKGFYVIGRNTQHNI